jgi:uncharacterized protein
MDIFKMPRMERSEFDRLIEDEYICRIAFKGEMHPYIAPFLYVYDGQFMYFLSTKYGKKVQHFKQNSFVTVEVENYSPDLSHFSFVTIPGQLMEEDNPYTRMAVRKMFVELIKTKCISPNVLSALGHSPNEPIEALLIEGRSAVWKLVGVKFKDILGLKNSKL